MPTDQDDAAGRGVPRQSIPINVWETDRAMVVVAPMPGVTAEDVTVRLDGGDLVLEAELRTPAAKDYLLQEWHYGAYRRDVRIGPGFGAPVTATLGNGLLAVSLARLDDAGAEAEVTITPVAAGTPVAGDEAPPAAPSGP